MNTIYSYRILDIQLQTRAQLRKYFRAEAIPHFGGDGAHEAQRARRSGGLGSGSGTGFRSITGPGWGSGYGAGVAGCPARNPSAVAFLNRNTPASKATSSGATISWNHIRS
jgi:hypothetical protein